MPRQEKIKRLYIGKLDYDDNGDYQLISPGGSLNISKLLHKVYYADNNEISIKIMNGCRTLFDEDGILLLKVTHPPRLTDYFINGENLEDILFNNTGEILEFTIQATALKGEDYGEARQEQSNY